ncbi:MAG: precorrin-2 C(20)-methyltransferase [Lachnospiraceae bacterium]|nr:precorrin-2 C(20)-methyltransferase [Lachnospiraceae bacterium]
MARLYGVSIGPGDYELMTLKAIRVLKASEVIAVPRTKNENTMALSIIQNGIDLSDKEILYCDFPMTRDKNVCEKNYEKISVRIMQYLDRGRDVAFITIGDVSIYSTFSYIARLCIRAGYDVESVPGVPSFLAIAAKLNQPLARGNEDILIMSGKSKNFDELMKTDTNKVIMKGNKSIDKIKALVEEEEVFRGKKIMGMEDFGLATEKVYNNADEIGECGYFTTLIIG